MNPYLSVIAGMCFSLLVAVAVVLFYIRYQRNLIRQQLRLSEAETQHQKQLLHAIIQSQEEERKRIGMDLHDEVGSALSSLRMIIEDLKNVDTGTARQDRCKAIIDRVITDVRNISHNLSPLKKGAYGFLDAIEDLCESVNQSRQVTVDLQVAENRAYLLLDDNASLALYRVSAELVNNTIRHGKASNIALSFYVESNILHMDYADDGIGLPAGSPARKGMGMQNIESRLGMIGASLSIRKGEGRGFGASIQLPLVQPTN